MRGPMFKKTIQLLSGLMLAASAMVGSVEGPYVVWIHLSEHPQAVDDRVKKFINSGKSSLQSLSRDGRAVSSSEPSTPLETGLCTVMPEIERAP